MIENGTHIKIRITINDNVSASIKNNKMHAKNIIFRIPLHVVVKMVNM